MSAAQSFTQGAGGFIAGFRMRHFMFVLVLVVGCTTRDRIASSRHAVVECPDGGDDGGKRWCVEPNTWDGGYDYVINSCHHAANGGVAAGNDGIVSCHGYEGGPFGHSINWDEPEKGTICLAEPLRPGSGPARYESCSDSETREHCTSVVGCRWRIDEHAEGYCDGVVEKPRVYGGTCCFSGHAEDGQGPSLDSPEAKACIRMLCGDDVMPVAFPGGRCWDTTYLECWNRLGTAAECAACCDANADQIPDSWEEPAMCDRENYREDCYDQCGAGTPPVIRRPCGCHHHEALCVGAECLWDENGCYAGPETPPLPPIPVRDAGVEDADAADAPDGHVEIPPSEDGGPSDAGMDADATFNPCIGSLRVIGDLGKVVCVREAEFGSR